MLLQILEDAAAGAGVRVQLRRHDDAHLQHAERARRLLPAAGAHTVRYCTTDIHCLAYQCYRLEPPLFFLFHLSQAGFTVTFGSWICVSLPFCVLNTLIAWAYLVAVIRPDDISSIPLIVYERGTVLGKRNTTVLVTSLLTILLFANFTYVEFFFGEIGIVAAVYVAFMFGSGILSEVRNAPIYADSHMSCVQYITVSSHTGGLQQFVLAHDLPGGRRQRAGQGRVLLRPVGLHLCGHHCWYVGTESLYCNGIV
jgi:hypothetical protein